MLISVVIPVYNAEKYINECIDSIINQTYKKFELILVDDGSNDASPLICDEYASKDSRIKVIHKKNQGVSFARRDAALVAEGEYIICVDADDWLANDYLLKMSNIIKKTNADIVCCGMLCDDGKKIVPKPLNERYGYYHLSEIKAEIYPHLIQSCNAHYFVPSLCGKTIKRNLYIDNMLSDPLATIGEDGACLIPCVYHAQSMYIVEECLYYYRYNIESATKKKKVFNWEWPLIVAEHISNKIDVDYADFKEQLCRKLVHDVFSVVISQFYRRTPYKDIVINICKNLELKEYHDAIRKCKFSKSLKACLMKYTLKKRIFLPIYIYSKLK